MGSPSRRRHLASFRLPRREGFAALLLLSASFCIAQERSGDAPEDYRRGLDHFREGRFSQALPYLQNAAAISPRSAEIWKALGLTLLKLNAYARAVDPLRRACELGLDGDDACYLAGRTLFLLTRYDEASGPLEKALRNAAEGDQAKIHRAIALNLEKLGQSPEAETHFRAAIRAYQPGTTAHEDPRPDYAAFLMRQGRASEALDPLRRALATSPRSSPVNGEMGRALLELNRPAEALPYFQTALTIDPAAWNLRMLLGKALLRLGRTEEGERELRQGSDGWAKADHGSSKVQ